MKNNSPLQAKLKERINNQFPNGRHDFIDGLTHCSIVVEPEDASYIENMIIYFNRLYFEEIPIESHTLKYYSLTLKTLDVIDNAIEQFGCEVLKFTKDLIYFKIKEVTGKHPQREWLASFSTSRSFF